jgi:GTPase Era involved in 16S rRNA processing
MTVDDGGSAKSCTTKVASSKVFTVDCYDVVLLDTPGFDNTQRENVLDIESKIEKHLRQE